MFDRDVAEARPRLDRDGTKLDDLYEENRLMLLRAMDCSNIDVVLDMLWPLGDEAEAALTFDAEVASLVKAVDETPTYTLLTSSTEAPTLAMDIAAITAIEHPACSGLTPQGELCTLGAGHRGQYHFSLPNVKRPSVYDIDIGALFGKPGFFPLPDYGHLTNRWRSVDSMAVSSAYLHPGTHTVGSIIERMRGVA